MGAENTHTLKMQAALRSTSMRLGARRFQTSAVNRVSIPGEAAHTQHGIETTRDWKQYSKYGGVFVGVVGVIQFFIHLSHHHHDEHIAYGYRKIRNKPFPWGDGQHSLFGCPIDDVESA